RAEVGNHELAVVPANLGVPAARSGVGEDDVRLGEPPDDYPVLAQPERFGGLAVLEQDELGVLGLRLRLEGRLAGGRALHQQGLAVEVALFERRVGLELDLRRTDQAPASFLGAFPDDLLELPAEGTLRLAEPLAVG